MATSNYDIFFISYDEINADENWNKLKTRFPKAIRINRIDGIVKAHKAAARASFTKMFYVVDADAEIVDDFCFDFKVPEYDLDAVYVWHSRNPVNGLEYGYGGVKLLPKSKVLALDDSIADMTTSISDKFKIIPKVSNITNFNSNPFTAWRSGFREAVKLSSKVIDRNYEEETTERLHVWCSIGRTEKFGEFVLDGAVEGKEYGEKNIGNTELLRKINDFNWLRDRFFERVKQKSIRITIDDKTYPSVKNILDEVGQGMCLAKWTQTTIHLGNGHTHSCHHPRTHLISIDEIKKNPSALHNTAYKKERRQEMIEGKRPSECNYCWNVEDLNNPNVFSDRIYKSAEMWSWPYLDEVMKAGHTGDFNPKYVEISFSHVCNFKCSYCMPSVSSQWMEEIERHGPYPTSDRYNNIEWVKKQEKMPIPLREENPYVEAFWKWWPDLYKDVHTFRITGGEPLLDKNTNKILDYVIEHPNKNLELCINSNLCVPEKIYDEFIEKVKFIEKNRLVRQIVVYTSCEAHGDAAEYIRYGLDYKKWLANFYRYLEEIPGATMSIMATYNALSVPSFEMFLKDVLELKTFAYSRITEDGRKSHVHLDIPYLNNPLHQNVKILTEDFLSYLDSQINFMKSNPGNNSLNVPGFRHYEINKLIRIKDMMIENLKSPGYDLNQRRKDFAIFVEEHDKRRGTDFFTSFPEMIDFFNDSKDL